MCLNKSSDWVQSEWLTGATVMTRVIKLANSDALWPYGVTAALLNKT